MFSNKSNSSNLFLLGVVAGMAGGMYLARWMGNMGHKSHNDNHLSDNKENSPTKHSHHNNVNLDNTNKDKLFETFMNASDEEISEKASQINLKN